MYDWPDKPQHVCLLGLEVGDTYEFGKLNIGWLRVKKTWHKMTITVTVVDLVLCPCAFFIPTSGLSDRQIEEFQNVSVRTCQRCLANFCQ